MMSPISPLLSPAPNTPSSILASPALGEVKGWFSNLFNWKTHSYVLGSSNDIHTTRYEVFKLLEQLGVEIEGGDVLRCIVDDQVVQRQVKFRVEFSIGVAGGNAFSYTHPQSPNPQSPNPQQSHRLSMNVNKVLSGTGYACAIMMVLEKGSVSTFRSVYRRLREEWRMDEEWDVVRMSPGADAGVGGWAGARKERFEAQRVFY
jgi:hypothetical protein